MNILSTKNLCKRFSDGTVALDNINIEITEGEIFCLLGPNGAGKTTLIGTVCGLFQPTSGTIQVNGFDAWKNYRQARSCLSIVPQEIALDPFITVVQTVKFARGFFGKKHESSFLEQVLTDLVLWEIKDKKVKDLSGGMRRRVSIAKALMNEPKLLFLDEPSAGVDVEIRLSMWEMLMNLKNKGTTIVLTTHYLDEAEKHADRIGFISSGKIGLVQNKDELMKEYSGMTLEDIFIKLS